MEAGIVGLPASGKTTLFRALTGSAEAQASPGYQDRPGVGVVKVPDPRLEALARLFAPRRVVPAEVVLLDVPAAPEDLGQQGISGRFLNRLQGTDALLLVVRAFQDPAVAHPLDGVDPLRDLATLMEELAFSDLAILERRLERLALGYKGARRPEREALDRERDLLLRLKEGLEGGVAVRRQPLTPTEARLLEGFQLLTAKPLVAVLNIGEEDVAEAEGLERRAAQAFGGPGVETVALCAQLEMELAQMGPQEAREFRGALGLEGLDPGRLLGSLLKATDTITFYTAVQGKEVRAWTLRRGATAREAAGRIHSDMARGFIRAEVIAADDLLACGGLAEARRRGLLRSEGKDYRIQDGDFITILFNV